MDLAPLPFALLRFDFLPHLLNNIVLKTLQNYARAKPFKLFVLQHLQLFPPPTPHYTPETIAYPSLLCC